MLNNFSFLSNRFLFFRKQQNKIKIPKYFGCEKNEANEKLYTEFEMIFNSFRRYVDTDESRFENAINAYKRMCFSPLGFNSNSQSDTVQILVLDFFKNTAKSINYDENTLNKMWQKEVKF
jgi:hypothetical protein